MKAYTQLYIHQEDWVMAMNRIQFQAGLSMPDFISQFGSESQCEAVLEKARWPDGFVCPCCGGTLHSVFKVGAHNTFQCKACRHQTSLIAGTLFQGTKLPLTVWFLAIYLISQAKTGLSSLALKRQLGVSYPTAWSIQHKLMVAMSERDGDYKLDGKVDIDDAYLGASVAAARRGAGLRTKCLLWRPCRSMGRATRST